MCMKRTLVALTAAFSLITGATQTAPASAQEIWNPGVPSIPVIEETSSVVGTDAFAAPLTALGNDVLQAIQQGLINHPLFEMIPNSSLPLPVPVPTPARGDCSPQTFNAALWEWRNSNRTIVEYCDGRFAWVSQNQTDWRVAFEFDGQRWVVSQPAGTTKTGMRQGCYNGIELRNKGASEAFISRLPICTPDEIGYSPW